MKHNGLIFLFILLAGMLVVPGCGSTKGYRGTKQAPEGLARIQQGNHALRIKGKKTSESAYLVRVDTVSVGSYMKGFPKYTDVLPGERSVEIRHFQQWKDKAATAGAMFGLIGASIAESNNPHTHYKIIFTAEKGKEYTIMPVTEESSGTPSFYVIDAANDTIMPRVVRLEKK